MPGLPVLCILAQNGDRIEAMINTAYGERGYLHAGYHAERWVPGPAKICKTDGSCGYDDRADT